MKIINLFKNSKNTLPGLTKNEKKEFLSNDFIERMIRVEQRVQLSFNKSIPYKKTGYYLSLTKDEKERFDNYLKRKGKIEGFLLILTFLFISSFVLLKTGFTGNFILDEFGEENTPLISFSIVIFIIIFLLILSSTLLIRNMKKKKFEKHFEAIDKINSNTYVKKSKNDYKK